jgi:hypothetical protein
MINYLEKYNNLPKDLKDKISAPHVMRAIHDMEAKYGVSLAALIMRVMVKDLPIDELKEHLVTNLGMESAKAGELLESLKRQVFSEIANYLDYISAKPETAVAEIQAELDSRLMLPEPDEEAEPKKASGQGANFYFSIEDEDEVRNKAQDMSALDRREQIASQVEGKIDEIISEINIIFSSEDMLRRLRTILKTYLRGVRDKIDTKQALERSIENGGLGLEDDIADDILKVVDLLNIEEAKHLGRPATPKRFRVPEDAARQNSDNGEQIRFSSDSLSGDAEYDFSQLAKRRASGENSDIRIDSEFQSLEDEEEGGDEDDNSGPLAAVVGKKTEHKVTELLRAEEEKEEPEAVEEEKPLVLDLSNKKETKPLLNSSGVQVIPVRNGSQSTLDAPAASESEPVKDEDDDEAEQATADFFRPGSMARARNKPPINAVSGSNEMLSGDIIGKVKMEDVKKVPKLGGPLEELQNMGLTEFRRLSRDPKEATTKIMGIFKLLEEEGFNRRMAGVKSWRQSPINRLYVAIGQESLIKKKDISKIITQRKEAKEDYLSQAEFDAIMELNKKIRF